MSKTKRKIETNNKQNKRQIQFFKQKQANYAVESLLWKYYQKCIEELQKKQP